MSSKKPTRRLVTKKGDESVVDHLKERGLDKLASPGVLAKVQDKPRETTPIQPIQERTGQDILREPKESDFAQEDVWTIDMDSLFAHACIAIGLGILIGLAFAFIWRDSSAVVEAVEEIGFDQLIPQ